MAKAQQENAIRDFRRLPEPVRIDQLTTTQPASQPPDPELGRDPHDDALRAGG